MNSCPKIHAEACIGGFTRSRTLLRRRRDEHAATSWSPEDYRQACIQERPLLAVDLEWGLWDRAEALTGVPGFRRTEAHGEARIP